MNTTVKRVYFIPAEAELKIFHMLIHCIGSDEMAKYREMYSDISERDSI